MTATSTPPTDAGDIQIADELLYDDGETREEIIVVNADGLMLSIRREGGNYAQLSRRRVQEMLESGVLEHKPLGGSHD